MKRENLQRVHSDTVNPIKSYLAFEVDALLDEMELKLNAYISDCEGCEYIFRDSDQPPCNTCVRMYSDNFEAVRV